MSLIAWNETMRVGIRELDDEHRNLIDRLRQIQEGLLAGTESKTLVGLLTGLILETKAHLEHEEILLAETESSSVEEHHRAHDALIGKALIFQAQFMSGSDKPFTSESFEELRGLLVGHLMDGDREIAKILKSHGVQ